ncbi:MAG TPA: ABC transporter permease [Polyangiaceae bacterium]|jgi:ABC-2 type transport system permease protein|nr:ABC transporter permease [Polyangiaceae bacterium]
MSAMTASFRAVFRKEVLHIRRNRAVAFLAIMMPLMQMTMYGFIDQTVHDIPTVVVDQDRSVQSRELMDQLRATKTFTIKEITESTQVARTAIIAGRAGVGVVIPPDFHNKRARGNAAKILVLIDGSDSIVSSGALAAVNGVVANQNLELISRDARGAVGLSAQPIILFNPEGRTANFIIPGLIAVLLQMISMMLVAGSIVREREQGTMEQLLVTPVNPLGLMLGKVAPYMGLGLVETALVLALMQFVFQVPIRGSLVLLFGVMIVYLAAWLAAGLFISTRAKTQQEAQQQAQMLFLPSIFLSGYLFPLNGMPLILQAIAQALPTTHMVAVMRGIVLRDAGFIELLPHIGALAIFAGIMIWLSVRRVSKIAA